MVECYNEFRSDTFTVPTPAMLASATEASVGDSVYGEDADTVYLENYVADIAGKEAGLFCVSGTMSNQIAIRTNLVQPPYRVLCDHRAHIYVDEAGGLATLSQAMVSAVIPSNGLYLTLEDIIDNYIPDDGDVHMAPTRVVSLENTILGIIHPIEEIERISKWCRANGVRIHLDGARLWNASAATGIPLAKYCSYFDSVSLCLSKSLGAPIGSVLVSDRAFLAKANHFKKQNGGGIRQSGLLARMALIGVKEHRSKLKIGSDFAKDFGKFCEENGIPLELPVDTNFVFIDPKKVHWNPSKWDEASKKHDVKTMGYRLAFHFQNTQEAIDRLKLALLETYQDSLVHPYVKEGAHRIYEVK